MFQMFADFSVNMNPFRRDLASARDEAGKFVAGFEKDTQRSSGFFGNIGKSITQAFRGGKSDSDQFFKDSEAGIARLDKGFSGLRESAKSVFQGIGQGIGEHLFDFATKGVEAFKGGLFDLNNEMEAAAAKINAFTKDSQVTGDLLKYVNSEAAKTPFSFQDMANAVGSLLPVSRSAKVSIQDMIKQAEILAASNPMQGFEGATMALREAVSGDFTSIEERFDISRTTIQKWKDAGLSNFEIVQNAVKDAGYDFDLVSKMGETLAGRWSTFKDTIDGLLRSLTSPLFNVLKTWLMEVQTILDANSDKLTAFATSLGEKIARAASLAHDGIVTFAEAWRGTWEDSDQISNKAVRIIGRIGTAINDMRGQWADFTAGFSGSSGDALRPDDAWGAFGNSAHRVFVTIASDFTSTKDAIDGMIDAIGERWDKLQARLHPTDMSMGNDQSGGKGGGFNVTGTEVGVAAAGVGAAALGAAGGFAALALAAAPLMPILSPLVGVFTTLIGVLGEFALPIAAVALAAGGLYVAWQTNFLGIRDITHSTIGAMQTDVQAAQPLWDGFVAASTSKLDELKGKLNQWGGDFQTWTQGPIQTSLKDLGGVFEWTFGSIADTTATLGAKLGPPLNLLGSALQTFGTLALSVLQPVATEIRDDLGPIMQTFVDWANKNVPLLASAWQGVVSVVGPALEFLVGKITDFVNLASAFINQHHDEIIRVLTDAWEQVRHAIAVPLEIISGLITTTLLLISGNWSGAWHEIQQTGQDVWSNIQAFYTAGFDILKTIVGGAMDWVHQKITDKWNDIKTVFTSATNAVRETIDSWSDGLAKKLDSWSSAIGSTITRPFEQARDAIGGIVGAITANMKGPLQAGLNAMGTFGKGVAGVVRWIAGALKVNISIDDPVVPQLASGTDNWSGGWAWVGEGHGGSGAELAYLSPGSRVIPHEQSMAMVSAGAVPMYSSVPGFAGGLNVPNPFDIFKNGPDWLLQRALDAVGVSMPQLPGVLDTAGTQFFNAVKSWLADWVKGFVSQALPVSQKQISDMINFADANSGLPYIWGGGHGGAGGPGVGFDCSGFVAAILNAGGIPNPGGIVTDFWNWMAQGRTGIVDIGVYQPDNPDPAQQHTGIGLMGQWYESGGITGGSGKTADYFPIVGHPPGWDKAKASPADLSNIDVQRSLQNMRAGGLGQWSAAVTRYASGGLIDEPIYGIGATTGKPYLFGESGDEVVVPLTGPGGMVSSRFPEPVVPDPGNPGKRWVGVITGTIYNSDGSVAKQGTYGGTRGPVATTPSGLPLPSAARPPTPLPDVTQNGGARARGATGEQGAPPPQGGYTLTANQQIQTAIATGQFLPGGPLREDDPSVVDAIREFWLRRSQGKSDKAPAKATDDPTSPEYTGPAGTGQFDDELLNPPEGSKPDPTWDKRRAILAAKPGTPASAASSPSSGTTGTTAGGVVNDMVSAVREGINSSFLFTVFGGGKGGAPAAGGAPGTSTPDHIANPFPMPDSNPPGAGAGNGGAIRGPYYYGNGSGTLVPVSSRDDGSGRPGGMVSSRFPEPVMPDPARPGERFVGVLTNTIYAADGSVIQAGDYVNQRGPVGTSPSGLGGGQPMGGGPPATYPWGLDPNGGPTRPALPQQPWIASGPAGLSSPSTGVSGQGNETRVRLIISTPEGAELVNRILGDPDAHDTLVAAGVKLMFDGTERD